MLAVHDQDLVVLSHMPLLRGLTDEQLAHIRTLLRRTIFPAGATIITAKQPGEVIYIILSGTVKIYIEQENGDEVIINILGAGDPVGEMSLIDSTVRSASVIAQEESALLWMYRQDFQECLRTMPVICHNLIRLLSCRLRLANEQFQALATLDVYGRVAHQLLAFGQRYGRTEPGGDTVIPIRLTQGDIASMIGASRERVNQVIVSFKRRKLISINQHYYIVVHDLNALAKRCGQFIPTS